MTGVTEEFGDVIRFRMGPKSLFFFNHPDHAKHVLADSAEKYHKGIGLIQAKRVLGDGLLTSEGDLWRKQRRAIAPTFHRERIAGFAHVVAAEGAALNTRLGSRVGGGHFNVVDEMTTLTLGVLGQTLLDADLHAFEEIGWAFEVAQDQAMFEMVSLGMVPHWMPLPRNTRFRAARKQLEDAVFSLVREREAKGTEGGDDMISRLLDAYKDETDQSLRRRRLRDELITMLLAGHETTASTLSWVWYLIDEHPEVAQRMHEEAVEVLGDREPQYQDMHALRYTTMVIQEAMRLFPPVWILPRRAIAEDVIDGVRIPVGADVLICPYTLHRHEEFWPDADAFDPERFDTVQSVARHRYAYIPFGAGPRFCVGNNLGMMEATLIAAMVARDYRLKRVEGYEVVPEPMLSLRVRGGLPMTVERY
jgi:cytochrome P450